VAIGRLPECDIVISDPGASRRHATITRQDGGEYVLTDLGSTNGTIVNDEPVGEHVLTDGDRITIGNTVLEFRRE
jgi:pSer/pThr/pTyr-binding forkhead associated (FHA) protein